MLSEGQQLNNLTLTRLISRNPAGCLFRAVDNRSGQLILAKVAGSQWLEKAESIQSVAFDFLPGKVSDWQPDPQTLLDCETEFLSKLTQDFALPQPLESGSCDGLSYVTYKYFDGLTLDEVFAKGDGFTIAILVKLFNEVDNLVAAGYFHGNLQPTTVLVGKEEILLTDPTMPHTVFSGRSRGNLLRTITVPEFYPFLDPRHDELALGILFYTLVTGKHPLALEEIALCKGRRRRAGPRFLELVNEARERGANRFLSPLLSFVNPADVQNTSQDFQDLVLKTLGFARLENEDGQMVVDVIEGTWLANLTAGRKQARDNFWTLSDTACAIAHAFLVENGHTDNDEEAQSDSLLIESAAKEQINDEDHSNEEPITDETEHSNQ